MANMRKPAYQGKALSPDANSQKSQGPETSRRTGSNDPKLIRSNEPDVSPKILNPKGPNGINNPPRG